MSFSNVVGRLAPSPTGAQHLGNARTYLLAWLIARKQRGQILMRIEDLDSPRVKDWAVAQAMQDLQWLGLNWDIGPQDSSAAFSLIQTERLDRYLAVLRQLIEAGHLYPCRCTRSDIEGAQSAPHESVQDAMVYPGTCRNRTIEDAEKWEREGQAFAWRFRVPSGLHTWRDVFCGNQICDVERVLGDFVVGRSNGQPAYQLAVVVDDHDMGVTEVVRGDDLIASTYRQQLLYESLGWSMPTMIHLPLVVGLDGRRLAKRHGDTRLSTLRESGIDPRWVVGYLAFRSGLQNSLRPCCPSDLLSDFDLTRIARERLVFESTDAVEFFRELQESQSL